MATTPNYSLRYPTDSTTYDLTAHFAELATDVDTTFDSFLKLVGGTLTGKLTVAATGVEFGALGPVLLAANGSPEGVVTAPVGSAFFRKDGGTDTSFYVKESGIGNTGWVAGGGGGGTGELDADLVAIAALAGTSGLLRKTAANTWSLDTTTFLSGTVGIGSGGTGQTTAGPAFNALSPLTTLGDILYASGTNTSTRLAGNTTTTKQFLSQTGNGTVSAAPAWSAVSKSDVGLSAVENTALSTWAGTTNVVTLGTIGTGTWQGSLIAGQYGGTGVANTGKTLTLSGNVIIGSSTNTVTFLTTGNTSITLPTSGTLVPTSGTTFTGSVIFPAATTAIPSLRVPHGTAPTSPTNGDIWTTASGVYARINGSTIGPLGASTGATWGSITGTLSSQSDLNTALNAKAALAGPTFTGVPAAPTASVGTNTTQLATTAFVLAQATSTTPIVDGTATVGTSTRYARADHVHPKSYLVLAMADAIPAGTAAGTLIVRY